MCSLISKCYWLPFLDRCMSGSRSPVWFVVDVGASRMVTSISVPSSTSTPASVSHALTSSTSCGSVHVASENSGSSWWLCGLASHHQRIGLQIETISDIASSIAVSLRLYHCCIQWMRNIVIKGKGGGHYLSWGSRV